MSDKVKIGDFLEQWSAEVGWKYDRAKMEKLYNAFIQTLLNQMKYHPEGEVFLRDFGTMQLRKHKYAGRSFQTRNPMTGEELVKWGKNEYTGVDFYASSVLLEAINDNDFTYVRSSTKKKMYSKEEQREKFNSKRRVARKSNEEIVCDRINRMNRALREAKEKEENGKT